MPTEFPYLTILETRCKPLEVIEEKLIADAAPHPWYNETLCNVNDSDEPGVAPELAVTAPGGSVVPEALF